MNRQTRRAARTKSSLDIRGSRGEMVLTPELSKSTNTHVKDLEGLVRRHGNAINEDLYFTMSIVQTGVKFEWGPVGELDLEEMEEVILDETSPEIA